MSRTGPCVVCGQDGQTCDNCHKMYYCGAEHQREHKAAHKDDCFPALVKDDGNGRTYMVATRLIVAGDIFLRENAIINGPSGMASGTDGFIKYCLGCYRPVLTDYVCSSCQWPVCNAICEKRAPHQKFECPIFAAHQVVPIKRRVDYEYINVLRCLLLHQKSQNRWQKLLKMKSAADEEAVERRKRPRRPTTATGTTTVTVSPNRPEMLYATRIGEVIGFIRAACLMIQFDEKTIERIHGVIAMNAFGENAFPAEESGIFEYRWGSFIFEKSVLLSNNCAPNTRWAVHEKWTEDLKPTYTIYWKAAANIHPGEIISTCYGDVLKGTSDRKLDLYESYYFNCVCDRCADPTEFRTFYSGIKCHGCDRGWLLPFATTSSAARCSIAWKCHLDCGGRMSCSDVKNMIEHFQNLYAAIERGGAQKTLEKLTGFLQRYQGRILHRNHFLMMEVEQELIKLLLNGIPSMSMADNGTVRTHWIMTLVELCGHVMQVFSVLVPGESLTRGYCLYNLSHAKYYALMNDFTLGLNTCQNLLNTRDEIEAMSNEVLTILCEEPWGSEARLLALNSCLDEKLLAAKRLISDRMHVDVLIYPPENLPNP